MKQKIRNEQGVSIVEIIVIVAVLALIGFIVFQVFGKSSTNGDQSASNASSSSDTKTYADPSTGLSLQYPSSLDSDQNGGVDLRVSVTKISALDGSGEGNAPESAAAERDILAKGSVPKGSQDEDRNILKLDGSAVGMSFTVLRQLDCSNVQFARKAVIYRNDYQITIALIDNNVAALEANNPTYFAVDPACSTTTSWKNTALFASDLAAGKTDAESQKLYKQFDQIISSITFK